MLILYLKFCLKEKKNMILLILVAKYAYAHNYACTQSNSMFVMQNVVHCFNRI
jgi:hypothetical protein